MDNKKWYGVKTFVGYEQKVADLLQSKIESENMGNIITDIYIPKIERFVFVRGKLKKKEELLYAGYIFVKMEKNQMTLNFVRGVKNATGYAGIRNMNEIPTHITDEEVETMKKKTEEILCELKPEDRVKVVNHSDPDLNNQEVTVKEVDSHKEIAIVSLFELFGESNEVEVRFDQIEKIKKK